MRCSVFRSLENQKADKPHGHVSEIFKGNADVRIMKAYESGHASIDVPKSKYNDIKEILAKNGLNISPTFTFDAVEPILPVTSSRGISPQQMNSLSGVSPKSISSDDEKPSGPCPRGH